MYFHMCMHWNAANTRVYVHVYTYAYTYMYMAMFFKALLVRETYSNIVRKSFCHRYDFLLPQ